MRGCSYILRSFIPTTLTHIKPTSTHIKILRDLFPADITPPLTFTLNPLQSYNHHIFPLCILFLLFDICVEFLKLQEM